MPSATTPRSGALKTILTAWLIAGTMDGLSAVIHTAIRGNKEPARVFRYIASAVFGPDAKTGGASMAIIGVLFHYMIALIFTVLFFLLYPRIPILSKNKILVGLGYGAFVWAVMNLLVVPMTRIPAIPFKPDQAAIAMGILMVCIGLPISIIVHNYYEKSTTPTR